ncbi:MAG: hydroxyethylthiazole kinase [Gammaproteobacteria bacterium]|jgi:hydroxyethylthiazole kinase
MSNLFADLSLIKEKRPIVHNITNYVVMDLTANALLAISASPIMAHALEEIHDIIPLASSVVINIGTLDRNWINSMHQAIKAANKQNIPIILDPVGAGATKFRTNTILNFLKENQIAVLRGNAAEIMALAQLNIKSKGVDSQYETEAAYDASQFLVDKYNCVVVVSGEIDVVQTKNNTAQIKNGHAMMTSVTGMGCTASAIVGAFCAINSDYFAASINAMATMGIAGELAAAQSKGPGSFRTNFIDQLYLLNQENINKEVKIEIKS